MGDEGLAGRLSSSLGELGVGTLLYVYFLAHAALFGVVLYFNGRRDLAFGISVLVMLASALKEAWNDLHAMLA